MRVRPAHTHTIAVAAVLIAFLTMAADTAWARAIRIDEGNPIDDTNPSFWTSPQNFNLGTFDIGFDVNFGQAGGIDTSQITIYANGYISFGATPVSPTTGTGLSDLVAAPFLMSIDANLVAHTPGRIDLSGPPFSDVGAVDAYRVSWFAGSPDQFPFQVVILDMHTITGTAGDFDLEFNYNDEFNPVAPPTGVLTAAGFHLGAASVSLDPTANPSPFSQDVTQLFQFRGGRLLGTTPPTPVPEPSSLSLIAAGFALLGVLFGRRRVSTAAQSR
jgi:hypothetical protein